MTASDPTTKAERWHEDIGNFSFRLVVLWFFRIMDCRQNKCNYLLITRAFVL